MDILIGFYFKPPLDKQKIGAILTVLVRLVQLGGIILISLNYRDARPIYLQIIEIYQEQIRTGILEFGAKLPSVRELASQLAINPNTIARAYRDLEAQGWITTIRGKGCFVSKAPALSQEEVAALLTTFEKTALMLLSAGVSQKELIAHLQGGRNNA